MRGNRTQAQLRFPSVSTGQWDSGGGGNHTWQSYRATLPTVSSPSENRLSATKTSPPPPPSRPREGGGGGGWRSLNTQSRNSLWRSWIELCVERMSEKLKTRPGNDRSEHILHSGSQTPTTSCLFSDPSRISSAQAVYQVCTNVQCVQKP